MAVIRAFASYGVLGAEKRTVYTVGTPAGEIYDEILLAVPGEVFENEMGQILYEGYDNTVYTLNEILTDMGGEPALRWATFKGWTTRKCKVVEPVEVEYGGGESRNTPRKAVDYMATSIDGTELYAEAEASDGESYGELKAEIIEQAKANGIEPIALKFWYDD